MYKKLSKKAAALLIFFCSCTSSTGFTFTKGQLISSYLDSRGRLFLSLKDEDRINVCVLRNKKEKSVILELKEDLTEYSKVELITVPIKGTEEIIGGVNCEGLIISYPSKFLLVRKRVNIRWTRGAVDSAFEEMNSKQFFMGLMDFVKKVLSR